DFAQTAIGGSPAVQTSAGSAASGLANTFAFGTAGGTTVPFYAGQSAAQGTNFAARWTGMIEIATPGPTTFTALSDDGMRLYVDNILVLNNDGPHGVGPASGTINLAGGLHDVRVEYTQGGGGNQALLTYAIAG